MSAIPTLVELEPIDPVVLEPSPEDHLRAPLQDLTIRLARDPGSWDSRSADEVRTIFDERAPTWHERGDETYRRPLADALTRGGLAPGGVCADLGSGTGIHNATLLAHFAAVVSVDLSFEMAVRAPPSETARVVADAGTLPIADASLDAVVLVNCFLFAPECRRVLRGGGTVVVVSTRDDVTPIYLPPAAALAALAEIAPGARACSAKVGVGRWTVVHLP